MYLQNSPIPPTLVTGGAGFIGSHVVEALLNRGHAVVVLDDLSGGFIENIDPRALFIHGSILDYRLVDDLFHQYRFQYVFHLAAYAAEGLSHFIRRFNYTNNVVGSINLINAAVKCSCRCFVFTSSIAVYGSGESPLSETSVCKPEDPYGIAKRTVELDLEAARRLFGLNYIIFRPHNVYGERQNIGDPYRNVIGIFMNQVMRGEPCTVFGDGSQTRAFTHVSDVAPVIAASVEEPRAYGEIFNVGADEPCAVKDLADRVQASFGVRTGIRFLPPRQEVLHAWADHSKARSILGYQARVPLPEGIARMAAWAKRVGPRKSKAFEGIELEAKLPVVWAGLCTRDER